MKYFLSTGVFSIVYTAAEFLLTGNINWKMVVVAAVIYAALYTAADLFCHKSSRKK